MVEDTMNRQLLGSHQNRQQNNSAMNEVFSSSVVIRRVFDETGERGEVAHGMPGDATAPKLHGTAPAHSVIEFVEEGASLGSVQADAAGTWRFEPDGMQVKGTHEIVAMVDGVQASEPYVLRIDTGPRTAEVQGAVDSIALPAEVPAMTEAGTNAHPAEGTFGATIDFVYDAAGNAQDADAASRAATSGATPRLTGTAPMDAIVEIYDNGERIGSTRANAMGSWTFEPGQPLAAGMHALTAYINGVQASEPFALTVADMPVNQLVASIAVEGAELSLGGITTGAMIMGDHAPRIHGTAPHHAEVEIFDNGHSLGSVRANAVGAWSFEPGQALAVGTHALTAYINGTPISDTITIETVAVAAQVSAKQGAAVVTMAIARDDDAVSGSGQLHDALTDNVAPRLSGKAPSHSLVEIFDDGRQIGSVLSDASGDWWFEPAFPLEAGTHSLSAAVDGALVSEPLVIAVEPAVQVPQLTLDWTAGNLAGMPVANTGGVLTDDVAPQLHGKAPGHAVVEIYDNDEIVGSALADADGNWSFSFDRPLSAGNHELVAQIGGVAASAPISLVVEPVQPAPVITIEPIGQDHGFVGIGLQDGGEDAPSSQIGVMPVDQQIVVPGMIGVLPAIVDTEPTLDFDRVVPQPVSIDYGYDAGYGEAALASGDTTDATPHLMGYAPEYATVEIFDNDLPIGSSSADATGLWQFTPEPMFVGEHVLVAQVEGAAPSEPFLLHVVEHVGSLSSLSMQDLFADEWAPIFAEASIDAVETDVEVDMTAFDAPAAIDVQPEAMTYSDIAGYGDVLLSELEQHHV
jgi:hypothetical protein